MSDQDHFLARWSRRKHAAAQTPQLPKTDAAPPATPAGAAAVEVPREAAPRGAPTAPELPFDPATLPPIESITAATDIRPFLSPGVPPELTRAALRRVWTTEPGIRDFVGLAEYAWDFNTPGSMPGFGAVEMTAQLRSEITRMVGRSLAGDIEAAAESREVAPTAELPDQLSPRHRPDVESLPAPAVTTPRADPNSIAPARCNEVHVAAQNKPAEPKRVPSLRKRLHGGALPKK
jgi:Protein of unknown function (DUF3306)